MKRLRYFILYGAAIVLCFTLVSGAAFADEPMTGIQLTADDRVLVLAPHPDDEVLGCAGIIQKALAMGVPVRVVFLTYGDNNEWSFLVYRKHLVFMPKSVRKMGAKRHDEALDAADVLGVAHKNISFLGYPDFETLTIWNTHWGNTPPINSMLSRVHAVPYKDAYRPNAPYKGEEIVKDLKAIISDFKPTRIFLSHPADHNPDHRALYLFTRVALWDLALKREPKLYPYLVHYKMWPLPRGYHPEIALAPPKQLTDDTSWMVLPLSGPESSVKYAALKKHGSQFSSSRKYLETFIRSNELFGEFAPIVLEKGESSFPFTHRGGDEPQVYPEGLLDKERAQFIGIEDRAIAIVNGNVEITFKLSRPLAPTVGVSVYLFGYRSDVPFGKMPKLHIRLGSLGYKVYDRGGVIAKRTVEIARKARQITVRVPLSALGDPQRILTSANTYFGAVPLDWVSWRIAEIQ